MNKLERKVNKFNSQVLAMLKTADEINNMVSFKGIVVSNSEYPQISICSDGLIAEWRGKEIQIEDICELMQTKGYVEPDDFI